MTHHCFPFGSMLRRRAIPTVSPKSPLAQSTSLLAGSATFGPVLRTLVATQQALLHLDSGSDDGPSAAAAMLQANANTLTREAEAAHESTGRPPLPPPCSNKWVAALTHLATANTHLAKAARGDDAPAHETVANQSIRNALAMAYEVVFTDQLTILTLATFAPLLLKSMCALSPARPCTPYLRLPCRQAHNLSPVAGQPGVQ